MKLVFYIPGNTWLHRLYPLTKLTLAIIIFYIGFIFFNPVVSYALSLVGLVFAAALGKKYLASVVNPLILIMPAIFAMIFFQAFFPIVSHPRPFHFMFSTIYYNGLYYGLELSGRIILVIIWVILLIVTINPGDLFTSLRKIGFPYIFGFMVITMLQFVPILLMESQTITEAQQSRGLKLSGFRAILPNLVPLFVGAWERAQVLAMSLEVRGMGSSGKKTSFRKVKVNNIDIVISIGGVAVAAVATYYSYIHGFFNIINTWTVTPWIGGLIAYISLIGFFVSVVVAISRYRA
ncbi:MAG: energy-coupling factor transporter transmembrane component T family protein [Nitrososphaeria archaeon]